jgi:hypothetical protein
MIGLCGERCVLTTLIARALCQSCHTSIASFLAKGRLPTIFPSELESGRKNQLPLFSSEVLTRRRVHNKARPLGVE